MFDSSFTIRYSLLITHTVFNRSFIVTVYSAQITRHNPTCVILLIDQSRSMIEGFAGDTSLRKADFVADTVNHTLHDLVIRCTKTEEVRDYYHVAILGYAGSYVRPAFAGALQGRALVPVSQLAEYPARIETRYKKVPDSFGNMIERTVRFPAWVDAVADGGTPMCAAFTETKRLLNEWIAAHPGLFSARRVAFNRRRIKRWQPVYFRTRDNRSCDFRRQCVDV